MIVDVYGDVLRWAGYVQYLHCYINGSAVKSAVTTTEVGIIITKYREQSTVHRNTIKRLQDNSTGKLPEMFSTYIPEGNAIASSAEFSATSTIRQKYSGVGIFGPLRDLTAEFIERVEELA